VSPSAAATSRTGWYSEIVMRIVVLLIATLWLLPLSPAHAGSTEEAERYRLQQELDKLARRNAWTGVERTYVALQELNLPLSLHDHLLGAQSAIQSGELLDALTRLQIGLAEAEPDPDPNSAYATAQALKDGFELRYGAVQITLGSCLPSLFMPQRPFAEQERKAYRTARDRLQEGSSFTGLLPAGDYQLDHFEFTVEAGQPVTPIVGDCGG